LSKLTDDFSYAYHAGSLEAIEMKREGGRRRLRVQPPPRYLLLLVPPYRKEGYLMFKKRLLVPNLPRRRLRDLNLPRRTMLYKSLRFYTLSSPADYQADPKLPPSIALAAMGSCTPSLCSIPTLGPRGPPATLASISLLTGPP